MQRSKAPMPGNVTFTVEEFTATSECKGRVVTDNLDRLSANYQLWEPIHQRWLTVDKQVFDIWRLAWATGLAQGTDLCVTNAK